MTPSFSTAPQASPPEGCGAHVLLRGALQVSAPGKQRPGFAVSPLAAQPPPYLCPHPRALPASNLRALRSQTLEHECEGDLQEPLPGMLEATEPPDETEVPGSKRVGTDAMSPAPARPLSGSVCVPMVTQGPSSTLAGDLGVEDCWDAGRAGPSCPTCYAPPPPDSLVPGLETGSCWWMILTRTGGR